ncbi:hypothetical protein NBRC116493_24240 [Aurantivibrio infirmus]
MPMTIKKMLQLSFLLLAVSGVSFANSAYSSELKLSSTVIYVEDNAKEVLDFYVKAFGFDIRYYQEALDFGELETGGVSIMIASYQAGAFMVGENFKTSASKKPEDVEIAFLTDNVEAAYDKAISAGAKSARAPQTFPWGQTAAYVYSIEGTLIGFLTPIPAAN